MRELAREDAFRVLHYGQAFAYERQAQAEALPGYVSYECPRCNYFHNAYDSPRLQEILNMFFTPGVFRAKENVGERSRS